MLKVKSVTARNIMSVGNVTQAVKFDTNNLTLVLGNNLDLGGDGSRNGTGKTTIINALSYGLYGEALDDIRKDNLVNKTNGKHMLVTVDFELKGTQYRIERGRKPNTLKFYVDGYTPEDNEGQGDSRETQKQIESVIGFSHTMFKHIVALNTYTIPFLQMKNNDQREMIEQLLGITEISEKAETLKVLLRDTKDQIREEEFRIQAIESSNERIQKNIEEIKRRSSLWERKRREAVEDLGSAIVQLEEIDIDAELASHEQLSQLQEKQQAKDALEGDLRRLMTSRSRCDKNIETIKSDIASAQEGVCPACGQDTAHLETHTEYKAGLEKKLDEETAYQADLIKQINDTEHKLDEIGSLGEMPKPFYSIVADAHEHKHNLAAMRDQLQAKVAEENPYLEQIEGLERTGLQDVSWDKMNELTHLKDHQEFLYKLLTSKDSFIRKRIIDQNLAYLNHRLNHYLDHLGLPHEVRFQSDLSVEITDLGRDLDFAQLSRGERNRLILSLSWAFRDIYESLNHPMNLLCIDELIDNGLDSTGVEMALSMLKKMTRERGRSIFLVSHREELVGRVNSVLTVVKEGGFTTYNTDADYVE